MSFTIAPSCVNLLKGQKDEEKFAGLLVVAAQLRDKPNFPSSSSTSSVVDSIDANTKQYGEEKKEEEEGDLSESEEEDNNPGKPPKNPIFHISSHPASSTDTTTTTAAATVAKQSQKQFSEGEKVKYLATILEVYEAVGLKFLTRLLKTASVQALAVNLFSTFTQHPQIARELCSSSGPLAFPLKFFELCLSLEEGESLMDASNALINIFACAQQNVPTISSEMIVKLVARICGEVGQDTPSQISLVSLLSRILYFTNRQTLSVLAPLILPSLASLFKTSKTQIKFILLSSITFILKDHHIFLPQQDLFVLEKNQWPKDIREGITQVVTNRTSDESRYCALTLIYYLFQRTGPKWAEYVRKDEKKDLFIQIVINVISVEVRVLLMILGGPQPQREKKELESTVVVCFGILELIMCFLLEENPDRGWSKLDTQIILTMQQKFSEIYSEVFLFLREIRDNSQGDENNKIVDASNNSLLVACIRAVSAWMNEETDALQDEFRELLPWLLTIKKSSSSPAQDQKNRGNSGSGREKEQEGVEPLLFLAPCVLPLLLDEDTALMCLDWCVHARTAERLVDVLIEQHALLQNRQPLSISSAQLSAVSELLRTLVLSAAPVNKISHSAADVCSENLKALIELSTSLIDEKGDEHKQTDETKDYQLDQDHLFSRAALLSLMLAVMHAHTDDSLPALGDEVYARFWSRSVNFLTSAQCGGEHKIGDMFAYSLSLLSDCMALFPRAVGGAIIQTKAYEDYCSIVTSGCELLCQSVDQLLRRTAAANLSWRKDISTVMFARPTAHVKIPHTMRLLNSSV